MTESVKVLTVYACPECNAVRDAWWFEDGEHVPSCRGRMTDSPHEPLKCEPVPYVPQAELDRLRAVGEELYEAVWALDLSDDYTLQEADPGELVRCSRPVNHWIDLVEALKSYREAVPEYECRFDSETGRQSIHAPVEVTEDCRAVPEREEPKP